MRWTIPGKYDKNKVSVFYHVAAAKPTMLTNVTIKNFGLIDALTIEFGRGLNIFTGATGAGKSILIDALRFCLGERLISSQVRDPSLACQVEAVFELPPAVREGCPALDEFSGEEKNLFIFQRAYLPDGRSRIKINGFSATVSQLREMGNHLVDFHGPHDHQMLLSEQTHRQIIDRLSNNTGLLSDYGRHYQEYLQTQHRLEELQRLRAERDQEIDFLRHQITELEQVPLAEERYEEVSRRRSQLINAEKLHGLCSRLEHFIADEDTGMAKQLRQMFTLVKGLGELDSSTADWSDMLSRVQEDITSLQGSVESYVGGLAFDGQTAESINAEYDRYGNIVRKYGPTLAHAREALEKARARFALLEHIEESDMQLRDALSRQCEHLETLAAKLSAGRAQTAQTLCRTIERELKELGMAQIRFECRIEPADLHAYGKDAVTFYISPNAGEDLKPLAHIVSSGEAARVMLALKKALTNVDPVPVLLFDEIDAQIGGRLGTVTGTKLRELAHNRQVLVITHLAQIASFAAAHFRVEKRVENNRTRTTVALLSAAERAQELAKMMSGEQHTPIALEHAQELLAKANTARCISRASRSRRASEVDTRLATKK